MASVDPTNGVCTNFMNLTGVLIAMEPTLYNQPDYDSQRHIFYIWGSTYSIIAINLETKTVQVYPPDKEVYFLGPSLFVDQTTGDVFCTTISNKEFTEHAIVQVNFESKGHYTLSTVYEFPTQEIKCKSQCYGLQAGVLDSKSDLLYLITDQGPILSPFKAFLWTVNIHTGQFNNLGSIPFALYMSPIITSL